MKSAHSKLLGSRHYHEAMWDLHSQAEFTEWIAKKVMAEGRKDGCIGVAAPDALVIGVMRDVHTYIRGQPNFGEWLKEYENNILVTFDGWKRGDLISVSTETVTATVMSVDLPLRRLKVAFTHSGEEQWVDMEWCKLLKRGE